MLALAKMFLPRWVRTILEVFVGAIQSVDTTEERDDIIKFLEKIGTDGKITVGEWAKLGSLLRVIKPPDRRR